ncbi:OmpA family protein [Rhizobium sp. KVB221]|uniref:OmpA family protein n=1 Tax=Rhizobium setariae TaxID=2801340 RepID=A0A936YMJ2_9HYPH|nr:OmpA family protein [Rhizobium setariae]MBL0370879.1 OmpA family protein [Rhizobium setariae]
MKKSTRGLRTLLALAILAVPGFVSAQEITHRQMVTTLGRVEGAAPVIDVALLAQQASDNVGKGVSTLPDWSRLAKLSQLILEINFENNSIAIEPNSYRAVGLIADAMHHPNLFRYKFLIIGHTSSTGDARHNLKLSQQRADAIRVALATTFAVSPDRLFAIGVGEEWPIDAAQPTAAVNRRVQLINLGLVK